VANPDETPGGEPRSRPIQPGDHQHHPDHSPSTKRLGGSGLSGEPDSAITGVAAGVAALVVLAAAVMVLLPRIRVRPTLATVLR